MRGRGRHGGGQLLRRQPSEAGILQARCGTGTGVDRCQPPTPLPSGSCPPQTPAGDVTLASLSVPSLTVGSELFPGAAGAQSSAGRQRWGTHARSPTMSWAWPFWKEPPESPLPSSCRSTTRHFTASWTWGERAERSTAVPDCGPVGRRQGQGEQHGLCLREGSLCAGPCLPSLSQGLSVPFTGTSTPRKRATALPAGLCPTDLPSGCGGHRGPHRPGKPRAPPHPLETPERPQGPLGGTAHLWGTLRRGRSHAVATGSSERGHASSQHRACPQRTGRAGQREQGAKAGSFSATEGSGCRASSARPQGAAPSWP